MAERDPGKDAIKRTGAVKGAAVGGAAAAAATTAAASAASAAAAGVSSGLAASAGAGFTPFITALGAAKVASLPAAVVFLANPVGAAVAGAVLTVAGAAAGYKAAKWISDKL